MSQIFLQIFNMSISAGYIVLAVLLLRLLLRKAPRWITVLLWGIVGVRLICPFSIESALSLIPSAEVVSPDIMMDRTPEINTGIPIVNQVINPVISDSFTPDPATSANPLQLWIPTFAVIWVVGMVVLLIYTVISYVKVKRQIGTAVLYKDNIYQSENVVSPFVLGIIKPKIYLPFHMNEKDTEHVVAHETAHIRRKDHLWKPLGFLLLTLHWFNPLLWLGYVLLCRDIELACDEKVIRKLDRDARADYSEALLACSVNRHMIAACPLAFGEVGVKERVKSVLNYKRPAFWIILVAVVACVAVAVCFLTNPHTDAPSDETTDAPTAESEPSFTDLAITALMQSRPEYFSLDASNGLDVFVWQLAKDHYAFGLLPHSASYEDDTWISMDLLGLRATSVEEMRLILSTYDVDADEIYVIPWQNPVSSYISEWNLIREGEDPTEKRNAYIAFIREMLFGDPTGSDGSEPLSVSVLFVEPSLSWVTSYVPEPTIEESRLYDAKKGELLGTVQEIPFPTAAFDGLKEDYGGRYAAVVDELEAGTSRALEVFPATSFGGEQIFPVTVSGVELYYVLVQKDGSTVLVYGHYENGQKTHFIRWIFNVGK